MNNQEEYTLEYFKVFKIDTIKHFKKMRNELLQEGDKYVS